MSFHGLSHPKDPGAVPSSPATQSLASTFTPNFELIATTTDTALKHQKLTFYI